MSRGFENISGTGLFNRLFEKLDGSAIPVPLGSIRTLRFFFHLKAIIRCPFGFKGIANRTFNRAEYGEVDAWPNQHARLKANKPGQMVDL